MATGRRLLLSAAFLFGVISPCLAQDTGQIFGRVTDGTDSLLPGVTVTVSGPVLIQPRVAITSATGTYQFPGLAVGTYSVRFDLAGFRPVVTEQIRIEIGFNAQINTKLELSSIEEAVIVTGLSPIVDVKSTVQGTRFDAEALQGLPNTRDVYAMFNLVPGAAVDRQNVGGSTSGSQTVVIASGASTTQSRTFVDGVDSGGTVGAPWYMDFNSIQEAVVTVGGSDASVQGSGTTVNIVTKSGGEQFHGGVQTFITDQKLQRENVTDELRRQGASAGSPLLHLRDLSVDLGGPIRQGRAWFWGAYSHQTVAFGAIGFYKKTSECAAVAADALAHSLAQVRECLNDNTALLKHANYNVKVQLSKANQFSVRNSYDLKEESVRGASDLVPFEATTRLVAPSSSYGPKFWTSGWPPSWKFGDQHVFSDRFLLDLGYGRACPCTEIGPQDDALDSVQTAMDSGTGARARSASRTTSIRIRNNYSATATYFRPGTWGGDHSMKAGFLALYNWTFNEATTSGGAIARFNSARTVPSFTTPFSAQLIRDAVARRYLLQQSAFVQDNFTRNRLTLNLGVRWDRQDDRVDPTSVPGSPFFGQATMDGTPLRYLPPVDFPGARAGVVWNTVAPRLGITYDLTGNGKNVVKASYGWYFDQRDVAELSGVVNPIANANNVSNLTAAFIELPWNDLNGDKFIQANELDQTRILSFGGGYNPDDPGRTTSPNAIDPDITAPRTRELMFGFAKELAADFGMNVSYTWRRYDNFTKNEQAGFTSANYSPVVFTPPAGACPSDARCESVTYFVPNIPRPGDFTYTNYGPSDFYRVFKGFEATIRKRMSRRWMLTGSIAYNDTPVFYTSPAAYDDPTNVAQSNGGQYTASTGSAGISNNVNTKWIARANGIYQVPWHDIGIAATLDVRQGYPFLQSINIASRPNRAGAIQVLLDQIGDARLPSLKVVDLHVDKTFKFGSVNIKPTVDVFNLFNASTVLARRTVQNAANANQVSLMLGPSVIRFGVQVLF